MITKELFLSSMANLRSYMDWEHKLYELGVNFWERDEVSNLIESYTNMLESCCHDFPDDTKWKVSNICYFIYDCDFGDRADDYFLTLEDGSEVHFYTSEDLWDYLVKTHPEIADTSDGYKEDKDCPVEGQISFNDLFK